MFRLKIALLSAAVSGALVTALGLLFLLSTSQVGLDRIDREIRSLGEGQLRGWHPQDHWADFDRSLRFIHGDDAESRPAVQARDPEGRVLYTSPACPEAIRGMTLPDLEPPAGEFVARLDADGNGRVSPGEFDGPPEHFDVLDVDADGLLSETEARVGPPAPRSRPRSDPSRAPRPSFLPPPRADDPRQSPPAAPRQKRPVFTTVATPHGDWRVGVLGNEHVTLIVGLDLSDLTREALRFRRAFLVAAPFALLALGAGGWLLAGRALRPVAAITRTAESITARDLHRRIPQMTADAELRRLVDVINGMLERLERGFRQATRFSSDAAHELQTPLTVLQGELDNAIQRATDGSAEQRHYSDLLEEVRRLKAVVQKLLMLARADAGRLDLRRKPTDLSALSTAAVEDVATMAPDLEVESRVPARITVLADEDLLAQVILNMTTNAVKHNREGGRIRLALSVVQSRARLTVSNSGQAIPPGDRGRVFDRFVRVNPARSRRAGGSGLGLSLAREIARAHGGDLVLDPDDSGLTSFTLTLPQ